MWMNTNILSVTFNQVFSGNTAVTMTTTNLAGQGIDVSDYYTCDSQLTNTGAAVGAMVARSQYGSC
jgi:hypothetical protein